jgi:hypothetical protein
MLVEGNALLTNNPRFYSALLIASGNEGGFSDDPSENLFVRNLIFSRNPLTASAYFQGMDGNNRFENNVFASIARPAASIEFRALGNVFVNNTFYTERAGSALELSVGASGNVLHKLSYNIVTNRSATNAQLVGFGYNAEDFYEANHNLYYNDAGTAPVPALDTYSRVGNPKFVDPLQFDFRLADNTSAAVKSGTDTQDIGAFQASHTCTGEWVCTDWSGCIDNQEIRICPGLNDCGLPNPQAFETRACGGGSNPTPTPTPGDASSGPAASGVGASVTGGCGVHDSSGSFLMLWLSAVFFHRRLRRAGALSGSA